MTKRDRLAYILREYNKVSGEVTEACEDYVGPGEYVFAPLMIGCQYCKARYNRSTHKMDRIEIDGEGFIKL